ncbi:MAG: alpha/beta fold hydrolase [Bryobacteraceae bacterium]
MRLLIYSLLVVAAAYIVLCGFLFLFQRSLIYFPQPASNPESIARMTLQAGAEQVLVSMRPHDGPDALIYFGGNAEDVSFNIPDFSKAFPRRAIYLLHYRGYGGSTGSPSEEALFADALALFDRVHPLHPNIAVIGRSLGSAIAVHLASQRAVMHLILITPFDSLQGIAALHFPYMPVRWLLRDKYESWRYAPEVTAPSLIVTAERDEIIPRASTELLRTRFSNAPVAFVVIPGAGHNAISDSADYLPLLSKGAGPTG